MHFKLTMSPTITFQNSNFSLSSNKMMQQSLFSLFFFLFSISTFYCWVVSPPEIYFFWAGLRENVSLPCLTCGWCVLGKWRHVRGIDY